MLMHKLFQATFFSLLAAALVVTIGCGGDTKLLSQPSPLTKGQQTFANQLAGRSGLDLRVVQAWVLAETGGQAAKDRQKDNNNNWLNLGFFDSKASKEGQYNDPTAAANYTFQKMQTFPAGQKILASVGQTAKQQIQAIANSGWAQSGYDKGQALQATYRLLG